MAKDKAIERKLNQDGEKSNLAQNLRQFVEQPPPSHQPPDMAQNLRQFVDMQHGTTATPPQPSGGISFEDAMQITQQQSNRIKAARQKKLEELDQQQAAEAPYQGEKIASSHSDFGGYINEAAQKYDLDPALLEAVIEQESGFRPDVTSHAGAQGLMQLMPGTAEGLGVTDPFNPQQNIDGGARYLRQMLDQFGDIELALAAYNAGPGNVQKHGGIPPFEETQNYVPSVLNHWNKRK